MYQSMLKPLFKRIKYIVTAVWALAAFVIFLLMTFRLHPVLFSMFTTLIILATIYFSKAFPDWFQGYLFRRMSEIKSNPMINYFRQRGFAPIQNEVYQERLEVEGTLPKDLKGMYMRNGPNPAYLPISYAYPFDGDGMLHAVYINGGFASYRNKYVETKGLKAERKAGHALYGGLGRIIPPDPKLIGKQGDLGPIKNTAAIHILRLDKTFLALYEAAPPYEVSSQLETLGEWRPKYYKNKPFHMNAHTRRCPDSGHVYGFTYDLKPPYLTYYQFNTEGELIQHMPVKKDRPTMMHDFVLTKNYLVFFDCPAVFDTRELWTDEELIQWREDLNTRVILVHRETHVTRSFEMDPFFVYHMVNGYEEEDELIVDYIRHETFTTGDKLHTDFAGLYRFKLNLKSEIFAHHLLFDRRLEFPRINEAYQTKPYRYLYAPVKTEGHIKAFHALLKYDLKTRKAYMHQFEPHQEIDEAVFIPKSTGKGDEDSGYLGMFVYNARTNKSDFVLLDAKDVRKDPVAVVHLPHHVPHGLHGNWFAD